MNYPNFEEPLQEAAKKERKFLILYSALTIGILYTGLIPTEISTLGIVFSEANQTYFLIGLAFIVGYYTYSYSSYSFYDYKIWKLTIIHSNIGKAIQEESNKYHTLDKVEFNKVELALLKYEKLGDLDMYVTEVVSIIDPQSLLSKYERLKTESSYQTMNRNVLNIYIPYSLAFVALVLLSVAIYRSYTL